MLTMLGLVIFDMYCLFEQTKVITLQNVTFTLTLKINSKVKRLYEFIIW